MSSDVSFYEWMMNQKERSSIISDLANDMSRDKKTSRPAIKADVEEWREYFENVIAEQHTLEAFHEAEVEYYRIVK